MKLSIIIVNWNVRDELLQCLRSIEEQRPRGEYEIIIVDNASTDGTIEAVRKDFPKVTLIINKNNRGFSAASNQAIKIAKGQYLFLLNPDTVVHKDSLDNLIRVLDENPDIGACGPKLIDENNIPYRPEGYVPTFHSIFYAKTFFRMLGIFRGHYKKLTADNLDYNRQTDVEQLSGSALMVRRSVMEEIGLWDESFFMYYEDVDLCLRIRKAGWRITYVGESVITHFGGKSSVQISVEKRIMLYRSLFIYLRKHKGRLATALFSLIFKPAVIIKDILNLITSFTTYIFSVLIFDRNRQVKSLAKVTNSALFLAKYSLQFLFKT
jgi:hypothetical protein